MTDDIVEHLDLYGKAFNSGDIDALHEMYTEDAIAVWEPCMPLTGQARRDYIAEFMSRGPTMDATVRQSIVTGGTAMAIVEWSIDITDADGEPEHLEGVAVDVLRRGADGRWRYVIDNPYGVSGPHDVEPDARTLRT